MRTPEKFMSSAAGPIVSYRRYWLPELIVLALLAVSAIILFAVTNLDSTAARLFYHPELGYVWPVSGRPLWAMLYRATPWMTGSMAVCGGVMLVVGLLREQSKRFRLYGLFILLCVLLGPGLVINAVLKDHWGRPRPRQTVEFGGQFQYVHPLVPSGTNGKSFPSGDASVGFVSSAGWWLWRRSHPKRAVLSLAAGMSLGTLLGLGRMAAGAHFLSDVIWSALIVFCVGHVLYYYVLRIPAREDSHKVMYPLIETNARIRTATIAASCLLGATIISGAIFATPADRDLTALIRLADYAAAPEQIEVVADRLDVDLQLVADPTGEIECKGAVHSFGLPTNEIRQTWEFEGLPKPTLRYRVVEKGLFIDIDGAAHLRIPVKGVQRIIVRVKRGDISVNNTLANPGPGRLPILDLNTKDGSVRQL